jgi:predicted PurR-regulated permease PerM
VGTDVQTSGRAVKLTSMIERIVRFRVRTILSVVGIVIAVAAAIRLLSMSRQVLTWILIALFLALALDPFVAFLMRRGVRRRGLAIAATYLLLFIGVGGLGITFIPTLVDEVNNFIDAVPGFVQDLTEGRGRLGFLQTEYQIVERVEDLVQGTDISRVLGVSGTALAVTKGVVTAVVATITILVLTFFMLLEGPRWIERFYSLVPEDARPRWRRVGGEIYATVGGFVAGALTIALVAGVTSAIVLSVLGVSYAFALALLVALLDLIPLAGATFATIVVATVAFLDSGVTIGLIALGWFVVYQQIENHVLYPLVYSRTVALSPLAILIAVLIGASLAGILGALAAIPIAGTIQVILVEWMRGRREAAAEGQPLGEAPV